MVKRILYLMRHAEAEHFAPGRGDHARRLTADGRAEAQGAGKALRDAGVQVVLASSAVRAAETAAELGLAAAVQDLDELYNAPGFALLAHIAMLPDALTTAMVVGHAPGVPNLAHDLADEITSDPKLYERLWQGFPTATVVGLEFDAEWDDLGEGRLFLLHRPGW